MKQKIRRLMIEKRKALSVDEKKLHDQQIISKIRSDKYYQEAHSVAIFYPMTHEIDLLDLLKDEKTFLFPRVHGDALIFYVYDKNMRFKKSAFGVNEPISGMIYKEQIDYMLIPALAIDEKKHRIGYGMGCYDRFLKNNRPKKVVAVIYPFQLIRHIETNQFDQVIDGYVKG